MRVTEKDDSTGEPQPKALKDLSVFVPRELKAIGEPQTAIPRIARNPELVKQIETAVQQVPTRHSLHHGDARKILRMRERSVHLVLTSPPYWTLKEYRDSEGQLGHVEDYEQFLLERSEEHTSELQSPMYLV